MRRKRTAFTLIELLVVIAIIAILIGLLAPAVQQVREAAARAQCQNNLKQLGLACHGYHDSYKRFPPGYTAAGAYSDGATDTAPGWGWAAYLLPYIEQAPLYRQLNFSQPIQGQAAAQAVITLLLCPSDQVDGAFTAGDATGSPVAALGPCSYAATVGSDASDCADPTGNGIFYRNSRTRIADVRDGTSQTVLLGERSLSQVTGAWAGAPSGAVVRAGPMNPWPNATAPAPVFVLAHNNWINIRTDTDGGLDDFGSNHTGGANLAFADGSVRFLRSITADGPERYAFWAMGTRAGGEVIQGLEN
jgi:prepilin-type N-terminal cleavage/methylation domain-containing protein/prepilin-type processing-associated H-X9-DG protein